MDHCAVAAARSPLRTWHLTHGATLKEFCGCELPGRFSADPAQEYRAVREAAGLLDLSFRTQVRVTGADRVSFCQGMMTNDVARLAEGEGCYAAMLTAQGRLVADFRVLALRGAFLLDVDARIKDKLVGSLSRYIVGDDVALEDEGAAWVSLGVEGPKWRAVLEAAGSSVAPLARICDHAQAQAAGTDVRIVRSSLTGEDGCQILVPRQAAETLWEGLLAAGSGVGVRPVGTDALDTLRIEAGIPWYGHDMDESRVVLEVGLDSAISHTKGCYLGQEVVERASARGHVNRRLTGLVLGGTTVPASGDKVLHDAREVGWVTSATLSPYLERAICLAYVRRECLRPGTRVLIDKGGEMMIAEVLSLPFYKKRDTRGGTSVDDQPAR